MSLLFSIKNVQTVKNCIKNKKNQNLKNWGPRLITKKWFLKNVAPPEIDIGLKMTFLRNVAPVFDQKCPNCVVDRFAG